MQSWNLNVPNVTTQMTGPGEVELVVDAFQPPHVHVSGKCLFAYTRVAELLAHGAVKQKVDAVVDERKDVEQIAQTRVDLVYEARQDTV